MTQTIDREHILSLRLAKGGHESIDNGMCVMEMTSLLAGETWGDSPKCVSPVLAAFLRRWNDDLDDATRQRLKPYAEKVIGTNTGADHDNIRAWMLTDWLVRVYTPAWLRFAKLDEQAVILESLAPLKDVETLGLSRPAIDDARSKADAARDAAGAAAWAAAWAAAGDAAGAAAGAAAWDAARDAARDALKPTTVSLQASAFDLLDRMIAVGK